jgi:cellulose synthase/poly-beta-1,6-N-acetylglucosamine synthase-like glycosyltransferase
VPLVGGNVADTWEQFRSERRVFAQRGRVRPAAPSVPATVAAGVPLAAYSFLVENGVDAAAMARACEDGVVRGVAPHLILIHAGQLSGARYLELLQARHAVSGAAAGGGFTEVVDAWNLTPEQVGEAVSGIRARGNAPLLLMAQQIDWSEPPETRRLRADQAANGLLRRRPEMSAGAPFALWQVLVLSMLPGLVLGGLLVVPERTLGLLAMLLAVPFVLIVGLRVLALLIVMRRPRSRKLARVRDAELPVYSVIVPLFREAEVVPGLVQSLSRLDYPPGKLDVMLVTESVDKETEAALRAQQLPSHMRVVVVPDVPPRTKPKALNYALRQARGSFVVVYDAEDDPEPDQLRRAQAAFRSGPPDLMCVQARLALYNPRPGWIARQFILEYAALFDALLPALERLGVPIPLGGTSNHFPRAVLDELGGWDAYNVTEDADLGMRIARAGGRVSVLHSTTYEEAPDRFSIWLPQRTRWLKGFMQTWLVHMRRPGRLAREVGPKGFIAFNALLGGVVLSALVHSIFLAVLAWEIAAGRALVPPESALGGAMLGVAVFNLLAGYASAMLLAALAASRRRLWWLLPHLVLMPFYWLMISLAAYRAVLQLVTKPYVWEKTPHQARRAGARQGAGTGA